ncbi:aspartate/glutamate racemase family protein [Burkholderia stagnalis]|nr:aspartate/glutamate racemase family protein [Burkholderia stagnalis]
MRASMKSLSELNGQRFAVIGGMGPLASAEFVQTVYNQSLMGQDEQALPNLILLSDPDIPDRTTSFRAGKVAIIANKIDRLISEARALGATDAVICCFTAHHILPLLTRENSDVLISLIDLALSMVIEKKGRYLLGATEGCLEMNVFQSSPLWARASPQIFIPKNDVREEIHRLIYRIKRYGYAKDIEEMIGEVLRASACDGVICGCTELHLLSVRASASAGIEFIDPLKELADSLCNLASKIPSELA